jgi:hypothetical protein
MQCMPEKLIHLHDLFLCNMLLKVHDSREQLEKKNAFCGITMYVLTRDCDMIVYRHTPYKSPSAEPGSTFILRESIR